MNYRPQLLLLAPESGDDPHTLSLAAQFMEMGVPIELDASWRLPIAPPGELSKYVACLFPESSKEKYDAALDAYYAGGGYLPYCKYYPQKSGAGVTGTHHYFESYGRDCYFFGLANVMLEGGLTEHDPAFRAAMRARPVESIISDYWDTVLARYETQEGPWRSWGDPTYTCMLANLFFAQKRGDARWLAVVDRSIDRIADAVPEALENPNAFQEVLMKGVVETTHPMISSLLMSRGHSRGSRRLIDEGARIAKFYVDNGGYVDGVFREPWMRLWWSESMAPLPALVWLAKTTGDAKYTRMAMDLARHCGRLAHSAEGLWHHWVSDDGRRKGAYWSRGQMWPILFMTESMGGLDPSGELGSLLLTHIRHAFNALRRYQDPAIGLWRLVVNEPDTRIESSATAGLLYCHDKLRDMNLIGEEYADMFDRAFLGLKSIYYRGGLGATCRGTATGNNDYYHTRPMGWYQMSLFPASLATRR